jgi:hypothetical protein
MRITSLLFVLMQKIDQYEDASGAHADTTDAMPSVRGMGASCGNTSGQVPLRAVLAAPRVIELPGCSY